VIGARPREIKKMTTITAIDDMGGRLADEKTTPMRQRLRRWNTGLLVSGVLGIVSGLAGLAIGSVTMLEFVVPNTTLYTTGTILIGGSFVLFGLAAHCIDKADAADKALRLEYCRQHGLKDEDCEGNTK
jgi:hypothetical protein